MAARLHAGEEPAHACSRQDPRMQDKRIDFMGIPWREAVECVHSDRCPGLRSADGFRLEMPLANRIPFRGEGRQVVLRDPMTESAPVVGESPIYRSVFRRCNDSATGSVGE